MSNLAEQIQYEDNCGSDLQMQNPMVQQAYNGFLAYQPSFHAGCLKDSDGSYCFVDAATNASAPTSSFIYYLPLGVQLPGGTRPTCNRCLRNTMSMFATYATNSTQPLSETYETAAQQVDMNCGPTFVQAEVQTTSGAVPSLSTSGLGLLCLFVLLLQFLL